MVQLIAAVLGALAIGLATGGVLAAAAGLKPAHAFGARSRPAAAPSPAMAFHHRGLAPTIAIGVAHPFARSRGLQGSMRPAAVPDR